LRAVQLLLGRSKIESTVRYLGIEVNDALTIAEKWTSDRRGQRGALPAKSRLQGWIQPQLPGKLTQNRRLGMREMGQFRTALHPELRSNCQVTKSLIFQGAHTSTI
jgi:hypothetical protein